MNDEVKNVVKVIGATGAAVAGVAGAILGVDKGISMYNDSKSSKDKKSKK